MAPGKRFVFALMVLLGLNACVTDDLPPPVETRLDFGVLDALQAYQQGAAATSPRVTAALRLSAWLRPDGRIDAKTRDRVASMGVDDDFMQALNEAEVWVLRLRSRPAREIFQAAQALGATRNPDYETLALLMMESAEMQGTASDFLIIAQGYRFNNPQDQSLGVFWLEMAADRGSAQARVELADYHLTRMPEAARRPGLALDYVSEALRLQPDLAQKSEVRALIDEARRQISGLVRSLPR